MSTSIQLIDKVHAKKREFNRCKKGSASITENNGTLFVKFLEPGAFAPIMRNILIDDKARLQAVYNDICAIELQFTQAHGSASLSEVTL
jgi:hypothetical protein